MNNSKLFPLGQIRSHSHRLKEEGKNEQHKKSSRALKFTRNNENTQYTHCEEYANYIIFVENNLLNQTHAARERGGREFTITSVNKTFTFDIRNTQK